MSSVPGGKHNAAVAVQGHDVGHVFLAQLKVQNVQVLLDPGRRHRLGDHHNTPLHGEPEDDLSRSLVVLFGNFHYFGDLHESGVTRLGPGTIGGSQWRVGSHSHPMLFEVGVQR